MSDENTIHPAAPAGKLARIGVTVFMLLAMILLSSSLIHAGDSRTGNYRIHSIANSSAD